MTDSVERLRRIWTPEREIEELFADLSPSTALDSQLRDFLCRIVDQAPGRSVKINLTGDVRPFNLRWEIVHSGGYRECTLWAEDAV